MLTTRAKNDLVMIDPKHEARVKICLRNNRLIYCREQLKMSQTVAAACIGISQTVLSAFECLRKSPYSDSPQIRAVKNSAQKIADFYNQSIEYLFPPDLYKGEYKTFEASCSPEKIPAWLYGSNAALPSPDQAVEKKELRAALKSAISKLTPREQDVMNARVFDGETLKTIAARYSRGVERIRQIEQKAMRKLRHPSCSKNLRNFIDL